jgi:hypothetical protein
MTTKLQYQAKEERRFARRAKRALSVATRSEWIGPHKVGKIPASPSRHERPGDSKGGKRAKQAKRDADAKRDAKAKKKAKLLKNGKPVDSRSKNMRATRRTERAIKNIDARLRAQCAEERVRRAEDSDFEPRVRPGERFDRSQPERLIAASMGLRHARDIEIARDRSKANAQSGRADRRSRDQKMGNAAAKIVATLDYDNGGAR